MNKLTFKEIGAMSIEELTSQREVYKKATGELSQKVNENEEEVSTILYDLLTSLRYENGLEIKPFKVQINYDFYFGKPRRQLYTEIYFKSEQEDKCDFGSSFSLYIYKEGIEINHGCCGKYSNKDKGQLSRDILLAKIWFNESTIIENVFNKVDFELYQEFEDTYTSLNMLGQGIAEYERNKHDQEIIQKIKNSSALREVYYDTRYEYHKELGQYETIKTKKYCEPLKIKKVTDKNVIVIDRYGYDKRYKVQQMIGAIDKGQYELMEDLENVR